MSEKKWSIIVHGGAKDIHPDEEKENREGVLWALSQGIAVLKGGGSALDAVEESIKALELSGVFNAGYGSVPRATGEIEMDASIMDGKTLDIGSIAGLKEIEHPISAARLVLKEYATFVAGHEADVYALKKGLARRDKNRQKHADKSHDTVGCVARDMSGNVAAGLSTGGLKGAIAGRVGDVPLPGCGFYADNRYGGVCMSGDGEKIARVTFAAEVMHHLRNKKDGGEAIDAGFTALKRVGGEAACIVIDENGKIFWNHNSKFFPIAFQTSEDATPAVHFKK